MSTARFARSGRFRICVLMSMFLVLIMMIVIYQMSQHQLDESRAFQVRCEKNQEGLNEQLQSLNEQKFAAEKNVDMMRSEKLSLQQSYDARLAEAVHKHEETLRVLTQKYDGQLDKYKVLEAKHKDIEADCVKSKKQHLEDTNAFEQKLQTLLAELQKDKTAKEHEVAMWKEKHDNLLRDSEHKAHSLEATIIEYKAHCNYVPKVQPAKAPQQQHNKPAAHTAETPTRNSSPAQQLHGIEKPRNDKSFNEQVQVSPGLYRIGGRVNPLATNSNITNTTATTNKAGAGAVKQESQQQEQQLQLIPFAERNNHSLILHSVENFQMVPLNPLADETESQLKQQEEPMPAVPISPSPLSAPRKPSSTASSAAGAIKGAGDAPSGASVAPKPSSSSGMPPLAMPPPKPAERKLPENVAPIPDNFENKAEGAEVDNAAEELPKNERNNRYANAANYLEQGKVLGVAPKPNEDSGAHEVKDVMNEQNFNLPVVAAENNFFDEVAGEGAGAVPDEAANKPLAGPADAGEDDDDLMGNVADVAVKQPQHLLDAANLNNEIAADQGKEFGEGLHLEEGMEEDQDEDDYSNLAARKQGAEAIRH